MDAPDAATANNTFLGPLSALARQRKTWSPDLLAGVLWRGLTNIGAHRKVLQLLRLPALAETARNTPRFSFKYLTHDYLVRGLTTPQRASCFLHHYTRLHAALPDGLLRQALRSEVMLHEIHVDPHRFAITVGLSRDFDKEGELSVTLHVDGGAVFLISFTFVPGHIVKSNADEVLLISRVQGMKGAYRQVHLATKTLHDVAPGALLLAVVQGIASAFNIGEIVAVTAARQSSYTDESSVEFRQAYDEFFIGIGLTANADGLFRTPVPIEAKPLAHVKRGHKIRTKEKRAFKQTVQTACADFLTQHMQKSNFKFTPRPVLLEP
ncbi:MAG: DUF535 family protein [Terracidiphilus sp.]